ncbi:hypothetical protein CL621_04600 [archaeon]|nr:hypothetical protein [archaeon]|tara:strand:+ start:165 stop:1013 length:849 start_codon:yes stop_codon:yes gene_type:complete
MIKFELKNILSIVAGAFVILSDFVFFFSPMTRWFKPLIVVGLLIISFPYIIDFFNENKRQKDIDVKFLEFVRNIVTTVKSGVSVSKAIIQISDEDYGALTPYVKKLARQIEWGFPTGEALLTFSNDTRNKVIKRSISIVIEAEKSGGNIADVLQSVTNSVVELKKMKEERKTSVYAQVVQGYIIFFVFIGIMLVLQIKLLPPLVHLTGISLAGFGGAFEGMGAAEAPTMNLDMVFMGLILIQGFFIGVMIGKFSEGSLKFGLKHSLALMVIGYLIFSVVRGI